MRAQLLMNALLAFGLLFVPFLVGVVTGCGGGGGNAGPSPEQIEYTKLVEATISAADEYESKRSELGSASLAREALLEMLRADPAVKECGITPDGYTIYAVDNYNHMSNIDTLVTELTLEDSQAQSATTKQLREDISLKLKMLNVDKQLINKRALILCPFKYHRVWYLDYDPCEEIEDALNTISGVTINRIIRTNCYDQSITLQQYLSLANYNQGMNGIIFIDSHGHINKNFNFMLNTGVMAKQYYNTNTGVYELPYPEDEWEITTIAKNDFNGENVSTPYLSINHKFIKNRLIKGARRYKCPVITTYSPCCKIIHFCSSGLR